MLPSQGGQEAGAPTQLRVWWIMGEPLEGSCLLRKHTQWEVQGELDWFDLYVQASGRLGTWPRAGQLIASCTQWACRQSPDTYFPLPALANTPHNLPVPTCVVGVWGPP